MAYFLTHNFVFHNKMNAGEKASAIFGDLDIDGDGQVDEDEFIR